MAIYLPSAANGSGVGQWGIWGIERMENRQLIMIVLGPTRKYLSWSYQQQRAYFAV